MHTKLKKLELSKSFFFYNNKSTAINVILETYYPFHVKSTSIYTECNPYIPMVGVSIHGHGCAEVEIICQVDDELIHTILHTSKAQDLLSSVITLKEPLFIIYPDNNSQIRPAQRWLMEQMWLLLLFACSASQSPPCPLRLFLRHCSDREHRAIGKVRVDMVETDSLSRQRGEAHLFHEPSLSRPDLD
ncbi:uncharacterized protein LOC143355541 [Halictus rubicundus]|uniref:uncharacterized protein LOC143355541 n=1 Tax=Halictus rubicundus TaxID=77578 RepID=UPI0040373C8C